MARPLEIPGIDSLPDRYVPRFEVFFAKAGLPPQPAPNQLFDPNDALRGEIERLDGSLFLASSEAVKPKLNQLLPLAGPWGEKRNQRTDDIISVSFTEGVDETMPLATVTLEVVNVYDPIKKFYRYTDIPPDTSASQPGVFPLLDYGDTIALRIGYGSKLEWVFDGVINRLAVTFPADGESRVTVTAVDRRDRLRGKKDVTAKPSGPISVQQVVMKVIRTVGLKTAWPDGKKEEVTKGKNARPRDQDALQFVTDRLKKTKKEALCFGNTVFLFPPGDATNEVIVYEYRRGLTSFAATFKGTGLSTKVTVKSRNSQTGEEITAQATVKDLVDAGLIPPLENEGSALDKVEKSGGTQDRGDIVTNYPADTVEEAKRIAISILKRNLDAAIEATGNLVGDPRVRARKTLRIGGVGRFDGDYYLTSVTHRLGANGYQTEFKGRRNKALTQEGVSAESAS